jgi:hypothetical protein
LRITPKNWQAFQHYKDRSPTWIKLHKSLLDDFEFHSLPLASKALAPMLWLLASESQDGSIDADPKKVGFRLRMSPAEVKEALKPLIDAGFFVAEQDASNPLAEPERSACLETEIYKEEKRESREVAPRATRFALDSVPDEWVKFCKQERPDLDPARTFAKFGDYWRGKGGQAGRKLDWLATWRNWVREERGPTGRLPDAPKGSAAFKDWKPEVVAVAVKDDPAYKQLLSKMKAA